MYQRAVPEVYDGDKGGQLISYHIDGSIDPDCLSRAKRSYETHRAIEISTSMKTGKAW